MTPFPTYAPSSQASSLSSSFHNIRPTQFKTGRLRSGIPTDLSSGLEQFASQVGLSVKKDLQAAIASPSHGSACTETHQLVSNAPQRGSTISSTWDNKEPFGKQVQEMLSATVGARLEGLVQQMVPQLANKAFIEVLGSYWDAFHQSCETAEENIQNQVDEGGTEIKSITNDSVEELEKCGRKYLNMLKSRGNKLCELVETEKQEFVDIAEQESDKLSKLIESHKTSLQHPKRSQRWGRQEMCLLVDGSKIKCWRLTVAQLTCRTRPCRCLNCDCMNMKSPNPGAIFSSFSHASSYLNDLATQPLLKSHLA